MMVISDEIFAGLWRLGSASAWERLHIVPDIACYAKLLTGKPAISAVTSCGALTESAAAHKPHSASCSMQSSTSSDGSLL